MGYLIYFGLFEKGNKVITDVEMRRIELMKKGYDPFLDYLKGFCILAVICNHCLGQEYKSVVLFQYWGQLAVPLFLILQAYHVFCRDNIEISKGQVVKMLRKIVLPFAWVAALEFVLCLMFRNRPLIDLTGSSIFTVLGKGFGPGTYYIWIYIQFFFFVPLTYWAFRRFNISLLTGGALFTLVCIIIEIICSRTDMCGELYRISCLRYIYLIFLGYVWSRRGIRLNVLTMSLSVVSIVFITMFWFCEVTFEPWFFFPKLAAKDCHWICYFYPAFLFMFILRWTYGILPKRLKDMVVELGHYSWHIFLMQMFFFAMFPKGRLLDMGDRCITLPLFYCIAFAFSTVPIVVYQRYRQRGKEKA